MRRISPFPAPLHASLVLGMFLLSSNVVAEAQSGSRLVQCRVESGGKVVVSGPCRFAPEKGGSFALENTDRNKPLFGQISNVSVAVVSPGVAEVHGLTRSGNNSRWGEARRSKRDSACWEGADFRICAH
jgi:hypothetical protein